jgi:hypothetical protein
LVPELDGPVYKGIFSDICLLLSVPNFPIMIDQSMGFVITKMSAATKLWMPSVRLDRGAAN